MSNSRSRREGGGQGVEDAEVEQLPWPGKRTSAMPLRRKADWPGKPSLRAKHAAQADESESPAIVDHVVAAGGGGALDAGIRHTVEPYVGADLSGVKVHTDEGAQVASASIGARAFTYGSDVFLGKGESPTDLALMAHELTHVVQQGAAGKQGAQALAVGAADHPAEREADAVASRAVAGGTPSQAKIVDPTVQPQSGQMTRDAFLALLRPQVMAAADAELGRVGATIGCPYIDHWFEHFATQPAAHVELVAHRFSGQPQVGSALEYIPPIIARLRLGVRRWNAGLDVNSDLTAAGIAGATVPPRPTGLLGGAMSALGVQRSPVAQVIDRLGPGTPIDAGVASRFGGALNQDVSGVRVHTGETAARLASNMDAAAFTVGNHVAFATNTYQPGTPHGDALLAHELAHVAQQKRATVPDEEPAADAPATDDRELAKAAVATESAAHETDAEQAGAGALGRLYGGAKSVMRKLTDKFEPTLSSDVQLQRCGSGSYEQMPQVAGPVQDPHLPMPVTVGFAGDRFDVSFEGVAPELTFVIRYTGPHRTNQRENTTRMTVRLTDHQFTGVAAQPYNATVTQITDHGLTVDLLGDHSRLAVLSDRVTPGFQMESRSHYFEAAMTSGDTSFAFMDVQWFADRGVGAPPPPNATTDPSILSTTVQLGTLSVPLHAQRFGTTNQVQLRFGAEGAATGSVVDEMVSFDHLEHVTLTVLRNTGRELQIDLNGDHQADARIVHTIEDSAGLRIHHLRAFTADGILLNDHRIISHERDPIPAELDERTHAPDTSLEWPASRPPAQADVPGELPVPIERPGGLTELRVDVDGDRDKDILMRFHPGAFSTTSDPSYVTRVRIDMVQISSGVVASQHLALDALHAGPIRPSVTDVADGLQPLQIDLVRRYGGGGTPTVLSLPPPVDRGGRRIYTINVLGQTLTYDLPPDLGPRPPLVQARPEGAADPSGHIGGVYYVDLQVGEQRDQFRFTAEQTGSVARFAVAGLADGAPFTGDGVTLLPGTTVSGLRVLSGDPRQITFDINNDGNADILINDRFSQPARGIGGPNMAEPVDVGRQHIMSIHGPSVPGVHEHPFFIFAGRWYQRVGFGSSAVDREAAGSTAAVTELQRQRGEGADVTGLISHFQQAVATQRHDAIAQGVITQEMFDAWNLTFQGLTQLRPSVLPTPPQAPTTPDAGLLSHTAEHAAAFARLMVAATAGEAGVDEHYRDGVHSRRDRRRTNRYTGEVDDVTDVYEGQDGRGGRVLSRVGAPLELESDIRGGNWTRAFQNYTTLRDGLDHWIADSMARRFGPQGQSAQWQLNLLNQVQQTSAAHQNTKRVQAVFVADNSYSSHSDYNNYRQMPLYLLIWREGTTWHLKDLTNPSHPYEHTNDGGDANNPSPDLFAELDNAREFPRGVIRFDIPGGFSGRVVTTERKTWADYVGYAAMILGAVALAATGVGAIAEVAGATAATVAVFNTVASGAMIASGVAGAVSAAGDMYERARHGDLDALTAVIDVAQIVAGIFTAGAASSRILVGAARSASIASRLDPEVQAWSRFAARAALVADRAYIPLIAGAAAADVVTVAAMVPQTIEQIMAVANGPGSDADRHTAVLLLIGNLLAIGAITAMSVRGSFAEIRAGRPNIVIDFVDNIPVAHAAGVSIGGTEIHVSTSAPDAHAAARWNAHGLEQAAHEGNAGAVAMTGEHETMDWYRTWMEQSQRVRFTAEGRAEVVPFRRNGVEMPESIRARLQVYLENPQNALSLYERSFINGDRFRQLQSEIPGLDLNPASESWQRNRARIIEALGGDANATTQIRRYEAAFLGAAAADPARYAVEHAALTNIVPQTELDRIRALFPGNDVYVTGSAPRPTPGQPPRDVPDLDVFVVVPAGTNPDVMQAMEGRASAYRVRTDPDFNTQHNHPPDHTIGLDAKVMTPDQFAGFATATVPSAPGARARTPATYHSITATEGAVAGSRQASAQVATRVMGNEAAADRLVTALGPNHARLDAMAGQLGDAEVRRLANALGEERFARYAAAGDGATVQAVVNGIPDARLRLLEARLTPQQLMDVWRGGGSPAVHLAESLAPDELTRIMGSLGGERLGRYAAVPGMDGAGLGRLTTAIPDATLRNLEARMTPAQVAGMFNADGARGINAVDAAITLEANGRLRGLNDWIAFTAGKDVNDLRRAAGELTEAQRLAAANPTSVIHIGGDQRAPRRISDGNAMPSFDMTVENPAGTVQRSVEVTTVEKPVHEPSQLTRGVRHAADKVADRASPPNPRDVAPIPGQHDVTIQMTLEVGDQSLPGGRIRRIAADGDLRIIDADGRFRPRPGNPTNLLDDIGANLGTISNNGNLDRVTLTEAANGAVIATYDRVGANWRRVP